MTELSRCTQRVKFGDVAINSTTVSADPEAEGFERYIIGKHIPADADRIETWGPVGDSDFGPRIRTIFQPGDVICTTRGPKLKVARVDFKGLGAHTNFYLRTADPEVLLQPYLEAVVRSNGFQQHLVNNFRGSVNLFVNWSDAAKYEFALPPLEEQRRIAEVLQQLEKLNQCMTRMSAKNEELASSLLANEMFPGQEITGPATDLRLPGGWSWLPIGELITATKSGYFVKKDLYGEGTNIVGVSDLYGHHSVHGQRFSLAPIPEDEIAEHMLQAGDLIYGESSLVRKGVAWTIPVEETGAGTAFAWHTRRVRIDLARACPFFLSAFLNSPVGRREILSRATTTVLTGMTVADYKNVPVPVGPLDKQQLLFERIRAVRSGTASIGSRISLTNRLSKSLLNESLRGGESA
jgi:type I restriction enzyme, S subunit